MRRLWTWSALAVGLTLGYVGAVIAGIVASKTIGRLDRGLVDFDGVECTEPECLGHHPHSHLRVVPS